MYKFNARIRYSEVDSEGKLSLESLLDYFQDASTFHSEDLGLGVEYLNKMRLAWVLSAWQIVVERYPRLCEQVVIGTAPYDFKSFLGFRNFLMETADGERLAYAGTIWTLVDLDKMKPVKPTSEMLEAYVLEDRLEMDYAPRKILLPEVEGVIQDEIEVRTHHLDTNLHVNNGQYVRMARECLPENYGIRQMRAEYRIQARLGDKIFPVVFTEGDTVTVTLNNESDQPYSVVEFQKR